MMRDEDTIQKVSMTSSAASKTQENIRTSFSHSDQKHPIVSGCKIDFFQLNSGKRKLGNLAVRQRAELSNQFIFFK